MNATWYYQGMVLDKYFVTWAVWCSKQVVAMLSTVEVSKLYSELVNECLEQLANLLQDQSYAARRRGATIIPLLYGKWSDVQVILTTRVT